MERGGKRVLRESALNGWEARLGEHTLTRIRENEEFGLLFFEQRSGIWRDGNAGFLTSPPENETWESSSMWESSSIIDPEL